MNYSGESNSQDCVSEIRLMCKATSNTYGINDITRRFNGALDEYFDLAFEADSGWSFDDVNQTTAAIATQTLTSGTNNYKISLFSGSATNILGMAVLDSSGDVQKITPEQIEFTKFETDYDTTNTGLPNTWTKFGDYVYLRPTPNYTRALGLRAYVERNPLYMTVSDTNKEPGTPKKHHMYLCRKTALPYLVENRLPNAGAIAALIQKDEADIKKYFATRDKSIPHRLKSFYESSENSNK